MKETKMNCLMNKNLFRSLMALVLVFAGFGLQSARADTVVNVSVPC